jgi:hypothetical protein
MSQRGNQHRARLQTSYADWLKHRTILEAYRARPGDRRTTPPPACSMSRLFPELAGRSATTIRLHPLHLRRVSAKLMAKIAVVRNSFEDTL